MPHNTEGTACSSRWQEQDTAHLQWPEDPAKEDFTDLAETVNGRKMKRGISAKQEISWRPAMKLFNCTSEITVRKETSWWQVTVWDIARLPITTCLYWNAYKVHFSDNSKKAWPGNCLQLPVSQHADPRLWPKGGCTEHKGAQGKAEEMVLHLRPTLKNMHRIFCSQ